MCYNAKIRILISFANFLILILISFFPSRRGVSEGDMTIKSKKSQS